MLIYYIVLVIMTLSGAVASLFLKKASASESIIATIKNINLYIGGALYLVSALLNIYVLRYLDYSVVLPLTSVTYIWTMVILFYFERENIEKKDRWSYFDIGWSRARLGVIIGMEVIDE